MTQNRSFKGLCSNATVEIVFVWILVALRFGGAFLVKACLPLMGFSNYSEPILSFRAYAFYVPIEVILTVICVGLFFQKAFMFSTKKDKWTLKRLSLVLSPLAIASIFSFFWLFITYPVYINMQYRYLQRQHQELWSIKGVKMAEEMLRELEQMKTDTPESDEEKKEDAKN